MIQAKIFTAHIWNSNVNVSIERVAGIVMRLSLKWFAYLSIRLCGQVWSTGTVARCLWNIIFYVTILKNVNNCWSVFVSISRCCHWIVLYYVHCHHHLFAPYVPNLLLNIISTFCMLIKIFMMHAAREVFASDSKYTRSHTLFRTECLLNELG